MTATADHNRRPDIAFISAERWPINNNPGPENAWDVTPDLCVEVVSPSDIAEDLTDKIAEYFDAGVRAVWVVQPRRQLVTIYESLTVHHSLTRADELTGEPVLPGFRLPLADLFLPPAP